LSLNHTTSSILIMNSIS